MKFVVLVNAAPYVQAGAYTAYQFCYNALAQGHQIVRVFFYSNGVYNSNRFITVPDGYINLASQWQQLAADHQVDLVVCVTAAVHRGIYDQAGVQEEGLEPANLAPGFRIGGLGQLIEAVAAADRFITFN